MATSRLASGWEAVVDTIEEEALDYTDPDGWISWGKLIYGDTAGWTKKKWRVYKM